MLANVLECSGNFRNVLESLEMFSNVLERSGTGNTQCKVISNKFSGMFLNVLELEILNAIF